MKVKTPFFISIFLSFIIVVFVLSACSKDNSGNNYIIKFEDQVITKQEFTTRLSFLPHNKNVSIQKLKNDLAASLVAEKIFSAEGKILQLDRVNSIQLLSEQYLKEFVYEEWMNVEIRNKITVTDAELKKGYSRYIEERLVEYWTFNDIKEAKKYYSQFIQKKFSIKSAGRKKIEFSSALSEVEDIIYGLKIGQVSKPIKVDNLYYIFGLVKSEPHPKNSNFDFITSKTAVEKRIKSRKENALLDKKISELMRQKKYSIKKGDYDLLVNHLSEKLLLNNYEEEELQPDVRLKRMENIEMHYEEKPILRFNNGEVWTFKSLWQKIALSPYSLNYRSREELEAGLQYLIRKIVLLETVVEESRKQGLDEKERVTQQFAMWNNNLVNQAYLKMEASSIITGGEEVSGFYLDNKEKYIKPEMRQIIPIIVKERELAKKILRKLKNGEDIFELAEKYSISKSRSGKDIQGIFVTKSSYGEIGQLAFELNINQISEIVQLDDGSFGIVKLIDIKEEEYSDLDEIRANVINQINSSKLVEKLQEQLAVLSKKYDIRISKNNLRNVEYSGSDLAVKKSHFPVRNAVPNTFWFDSEHSWFQTILSK